MPTYTDIIRAEIHGEGWSYGQVSFTDGERTMWKADAHKDGKRCVCHAETLLRAMLELRGMVEGR
jgi:hypothetical protein